MKQITRILALALLATSLVACEEKDNENVDAHSGATVEALVLNEGGWGANNASITAINVATSSVVESDWFSAKNNRGLGDVAQDMMQYGSKVYATVTFSNSIEVIDVKTGLSQRIDMGNAKPRSLAADGGKIYVTCYNPRSVMRIDTLSLTVEATCPLGNYQPEGIAIAGGKAFVASSYIEDGGNFLYDNHVYVVDLATFVNPTAIEVGSNPGIVKKIDDNKVMVCYAGDYGALPAGSAIIDVNSLEVTQTNTELANFDVYNGKAYGYASTWVQVGENWEQSIGFFCLDPTTLVSTPILQGSVSGNPYGIAVNSYDGDIYVLTDGNYSSNGDIICFTNSGSHRFTLEAGILPKKVLFLSL